ncbi:MAG: ABC transporter substrate-binding protein [Comamonas sp.]
MTDSISPFTGAARPLARRRLLAGTALAAASLPLGLLASRASHAQGQAGGGKRRIKLAWMPTALCHIAVPVALHKGFFDKYDIEADTISWEGSTDLLLQALSSGDSDVALGMALRWIKPLEAGFDIKLTGATHGGCMNLLAKPSANLHTFEDLRGKIIGVGDIAGVDRNFFAIALAKRGIDPNKDVEWRQFPKDLLGAAIDKGDADLISTSDPLAYLFKQRNGLVEVVTNVSAEYADRSCCIIGVRGSLWRENKAVPIAATHALVEAAQWTHENPDEAAQIYAQYAPKQNPADLGRMLRALTNHRHPIGGDFRQEIIDYTEELKTVKVIKPTTDSRRFADRVVVDIT